ncbi:MAG: ABC transporter permease [Oscillospiraceae bacterium]|nr:ABC transporter permease [Oscillospiraceae bacterium]
MNRILAVMKKQFKDTLKNKVVLLQFIMFPVIAFVFTEFVAKKSDEIDNFMFVAMFAPIYAGMIPLVNMANIIAEEREKKSLKMLIMSNVKPYEYLIGVGGHVLLLCALGSLVMAMSGGYSGAELFRFVFIMVIGALASLFVGAAIGIFSKNQSSSTAMATPFALVTSFIPMLAIFNENFSSVARILYTQQISFMMADMSATNFTWDRFAIIGANMLVFLGLFIFAYKKVDLKD